MHRGARRGLGIGLGVLGVVALLPFVVGGVTGLVTGPRSKLGVRRKIQRIRDAGMVSQDYNDVEETLREQGLL
jgi:dUTPase